MFKWMLYNFVGVLSFKASIYGFINVYQGGVFDWNEWLYLEVLSDVFCEFFKVPNRIMIDLLQRKGVWWVFWKKVPYFDRFGIISWMNFVDWNGYFKDCFDRYWFWSWDLQSWAEIIALNKVK